MRRKEGAELTCGLCFELPLRETREAKAVAFVQEGSAWVHALNGLNAARAAAAQNASVRDAALPTPPHAIGAAPH